MREAQLTGEKKSNSMKRSSHLPTEQREGLSSSPAGIRTGSKAGAPPQEGGKRGFLSSSVHPPHLLGFGKQDEKGVPAYSTVSSTGSKQLSRVDRRLQSCRQALWAALHGESATCPASDEALGSRKEQNNKGKESAQFKCVI